MTKLKNPVASCRSDTTGFQMKLNAKDSTLTHTVKPGTKEHAVLSALATGQSFNRFDAERELHDHCLHSTVSTLQGKGIRIHREREKVLCLGGTAKINVMRYRLLPDQIPKANQLVGLAEGRAAI